jgi:hypothetical protein
MTERPAVRAAARAAARPSSAWPGVGRRLAFALVLLLALTASTGASRAIGQDGGPLRASAAVPADLAFVARDGGLAWLPAGATEARRLGADGVRHAFPVWSPDGLRVAAIARDERGARVVVAEPRGDGGARVETWFDRTDAPAVYLDWSSNGRSLLVLAVDAEAGFALHRVAAGDAAVLARGAPLYWDEGADGRLLVHVGDGPRAGVRVLGPDGEVVREVGPAGAFRSPAWSRDGGWLAFAERASGDVRRVVIERSEEAEDPVSEPSSPRLGDAADRRALDHRGLAAFAWHPGRPLLAVVRPLTDAPHAYGPLGVLDADDGLFSPWLDRSVLAFWWAPDGARMAVLAADAPAPSRIAGRASTSGSRHVQRGAPGFRFGFLDPERGEVARWTPVAPAADFVLERLPHVDQYARSHALWTPDGRAFALAVQDAEGRPSVGLFEVGGTRREIVPGSMPAFAPVAR